MLLVSKETQQLALEDFQFIQVPNENNNFNKIVRIVIILTILFPVALKDNRTIVAPTEVQNHLEWLLLNIPNTPAFSIITFKAIVILKFKKLQLKELSKLE